jgi:hypothetical protein
MQVRTVEYWLLYQDVIDSEGPCVTTVRVHECHQFLFRPGCLALYQLSNPRLEIRSRVCARYYVQHSTKQDHFTSPSSSVLLPERQYSTQPHAYNTRLQALALDDAPRALLTATLPIRRLLAFGNGRAAGCRRCSRMWRVFDLFAAVGFVV